MDDLNKAALKQFLDQDVSSHMILYLADAANNIIPCNPTLVLLPLILQSSTLLHTLKGRCTLYTDPILPTLNDFITQLVKDSRVPVSTLMSTLVYLNRLKSKLSPKKQSPKKYGPRCIAHRIFLAALILSDKYHNDRSPNNKDWAEITGNFGFKCKEVNWMEREVLFLIEWELRITEHDLYYELDFFLNPLRNYVIYRQKVSEQADEIQLLKLQLSIQRQLSELVSHLQSGNEIKPIKLRHSTFRFSKQTDEGESIKPRPSILQLPKQADKGKPRRIVKIIRQGRTN